MIREVKTLSLGWRRGRKGKDGTYENREMYFVPLPIGSVKSVLLGVRMPPEACDEILASLQANDARHIRHFVLRPHPTKYMLEGYDA